MVNWSDPSEIAKDSDVIPKIVFSLFGVYVWELFVTWDFEWSLISQRRSFRWPLVFFFFCRYCILFAIIGLIISLSATSQINCGALYTFNSWTGNMSILCASTSLMLRTIALWERRRSIIAILGTLCIAHWTLLYRTMFIVVSAWEPDAKTCVVVQTNPSLLNTTFFFTMGFDFIILIFTAIALLARHSARTDLWKLLFQDGLVYFLVSFSTNCIPAVLNVLNLNTPMNVVATIPAATITSMAACRAVMRLLDFNCNDVYVHSVSAAMAGANTNNSNSAPVPTTRQSLTSHFKSQKMGLTRPEIHVTTEHITMAEFPISRTGTPYMRTEGQHRKSSTDIQSTRETDATSDKDEKSSFEFPPV